MDRDALAARLLASFVMELEEQVGTMNDDLLALERAPGDADRLRSLFRVLHTLKGASRAAGVPPIEKLTHALETRLVEVRDGARALQTADFATLFRAADALESARHRLKAGQPLADPLVADPADSSVGVPVVPRPGAGSPAPEEEAPASRATRSRDGQVRVEAGKLDALLDATGELLVSGGRVTDRAGELQALHDLATHSATDWKRAGRRLRLALERAGAPPAVVQELEVLEDRMREMVSESGRIATTASDDARSLGQATDEMADRVRRLRMRPFGEACEALPRAVRDLAAASGKDIAVDVAGAGVEVDRAVLDGLREALLHLVRNAVDHGIESPTTRVKAGKPAQGTIAIEAVRSGARLVVRVADDGGGFDINAIRSQLRRKGRPVPESERDLVRTLFEPGFSTRVEATTVSGRGVGLDAVRAAMDTIRGTVDVHWVAGQGTTFSLECPPTLATIRVLLVSVGGQVLAVPALNVDRMLRVRADEIRRGEGREIITTASGPVPLVALARLLPPLTARPADAAVTVLLLRAGERRLAVAVDALIAEQEIVVRQLGAGAETSPLLAGATILSTGRVALVLHGPAVIAAGLAAPGGDVTFETARAATGRRRVLVVDDSLTTRTLEQSVLEAAGYEVATAVDGADGWRLLQERGADVVISDVEMPRMDGFGLCEAIRASRRFKELPVVLVTGLEKPEDRARGLQAGADAYLGKSSFDQRALLDTVAQLVGRGEVVIRTVVADDSVTMRELLVHILESDPDITVVGQARNGAEAVELASRLRPDLVAMDVHMPVMDGLAATREIMTQVPTPIVIVSSSVSGREADLSLEAMRAGALVVVRKPDDPRSERFESRRRELLSMIKAMAQVKVVRRWPRREPVAPGHAAPVAPSPAPATPVRLVAVAASTGGPAALQRIFSALPATFPAPILVAQHIATGFVSGLASWLSGACKLRVKVADQGEGLVGGTVYLAPDDRHLGVRAGGLALVADLPPVGGFRPSGTYLFQSVAKVYGASATGVILTGMGSDGVEGLRALRAAGARILAQDEATSVVYGMPGAAVAAGVVDAVLPIDQVAELLARFAGAVPAA